MQQTELVKVQERIELLSNGLRPLFDFERRDAYEQARLTIAGKPVEEKDYPEIVKVAADPSEYPPLMVGAVVALCIVVLGAAFALSAFRIYSAGYNVFCESFETYAGAVNTDYCKIAGWSTVIMAETGQTVALLAIAVLGTTSIQQSAYGNEAVYKLQKATKQANKIFWSVAIMSTLIAYIGNLHVAKPWEHTDEFFGAFAWVLDLFPPTIVIGVMYALKELMLYYIRKRFTYLASLSRAKQERLNQITEDRRTRQAWLDSPENHPQWLRQYSIALRDALVRANDRQKGERKSKALDERLDLIKSLSTEEWKYLIKREMVADDFTVNPKQLTVVEKVQEKIEERASEEPSLQLTTKLTEESAAPLDQDIWQTPDGSWAFKSQYTGKIYDGYDSEQVAKQKRYAHHYSYKRNHGIKD